MTPPRRLSSRAFLVPLSVTFSFVSMAPKRLADTAQAVRAVFTLDHIKTALFVYVLLTRSVKAQRHLWARGLTQTVRDFVSWLTQRILFLALRLPSARRKVSTEMGKARLDIESKLVPKGADVSRHLTLPGKGQSAEWIKAEMGKMDDEAVSRTDYKHGKLSGAVYRTCRSSILDNTGVLTCNVYEDGGDDMEKIAVAAFQRYCVSNPLHPDVFPAIRKMDAEIVAMCLSMYNSSNGAGTTTSGGTESILMSVKTHRDWARRVKGITEPELYVLPVGRLDVLSNVMNQSCSSVCACSFLQGRRVL